MWLSLSARARATVAVVALAAVLMVTGGPQPHIARAQQPLTGAPVRLVLPSIDINAHIDPFDLNPDLTMPVPQVASLVAWYTFSPPAGADGNVVLAGHRDWQRQKGVFYDLGKLREGDEVWLQDAHLDWYLYRVVWSISIDDDAAPVDDITGFTDVPSVTLITCSGTFDRAAGHYVERRIVRAQLDTAVPAGPPDDDSSE